MINKVSSYARCKRIIEDAIKRLELNLCGINVLTELASGNFIVTPIIAALSGADRVYLVCKDSRYGSVSELLIYLYEFADYCQISKDVFQLVDSKESVAKHVHLVTNSGFVRPIDSAFIGKLPDDAAISLMFESWEFRKEDLDLASCIMHNVPVLGVNERNENLRIFRYVGMSVLKLLLEEDIEVFKGRFLLLSSGDYLKEIKTVLENNDAEVVCIDSMNPITKELEVEGVYDALIVAEQQNSDCLISENSGYINKRVLRRCEKVIHIAGVLDDEYLRKQEILKYPSREIGYGYMTVTTDYVGVRPVIELNTGGLKVGQLLVEGMRKCGNYLLAQKYAMENSISMCFEMRAK